MINPDMIHSVKEFPGGWHVVLYLDDLIYTRKRAGK